MAGPSEGCVLYLLLLSRTGPAILLKATIPRNLISPRDDLSLHPACSCPHRAPAAPAEALQCSSACPPAPSPSPPTSSSGLAALSQGGLRILSSALCVWLWGERVLLIQTKLPWNSSQFFYLSLLDAGMPGLQVCVHTANISRTPRLVCTCYQTSPLP